MKREKWKETKLKGKSYQIFYYFRAEDLSETAQLEIVLKYLLKEKQNWLRPVLRTMQICLAWFYRNFLVGMQNSLKIIVTVQIVRLYNIVNITKYVTLDTTCNHKNSAM
jgi:hypothetical protein